MTQLLEFYVPEIRADRQLIWLRTRTEENGAHKRNVSERETVVRSYTATNRLNSFRYCSSGSDLPRGWKSSKQFSSAPPLP